MKILVVDDEVNITNSIVNYLKLEKFETKEAYNGLSAKRLLEDEVFDIAIIDLKMPGMNGLELLKWIQDNGQQVPVIMISAYGEINDAVEAMKLGARDYIVKPFNPEELVIRLKRILEEKKIQNMIEADKTFTQKDDPLIGKSNKIIEIKKFIAKIAKTYSTVLLLGESGTGKEIAARSIHDQSDRNKALFVPINIGGIPKNLLESELFGYEKGAFTGAVQRKLGMFELASKGTLFLDEIGDMPVELQVKLLRVLQDKKIQRLGGTENIPIDVRIISATNRNLESLIKENNFREDLYFRLNVIRIEIPPLRERLDDIPLLAGHLIKKLNINLSKNIKGITSNAIDQLQQYNYPGNIRELENILERAFILCESNMITEKDLGMNMVSNVNQKKITKIKNIEKQAVIEALHRWDGNRTKTANELGVSRRTIINKIKEYNINL